MLSNRIYMKETLVAINEDLRPAVSRGGECFLYMFGVYFIFLIKENILHTKAECSDFCFTSLNETQLLSLTVFTEYDIST